MPSLHGGGLSRSVRVGNELGACRPRTARFAVVVVTVTSVVISVTLAALVLILRRQLSLAFTSTEEVIAAVSSLTPLLSLSVLLNGVQPILSGSPSTYTTYSYIELSHFFWGNLYH